MRDSHECPTCKRRLPSQPVPMTTSTPWSDDCICTDTAPCVYHAHRMDEMPKRPRSDELLQRARDKCARELRAWRRMARRVKEDAMTDPTPTPADLERAREWWRSVAPSYQPLVLTHDGSAESREEVITSLAALLRSVREEGARQERERWQRACEEERGLAQRMLDDERPHTLAWKGRLAVIADILDTVTDENPTP